VGKGRGLFERDNAPAERDETLQAELFHELAEAVTRRHRDDSADPRNVP
jgi:hypothetical protein